MNCQQVDKYILDYCNHTLPPQLAQELEAHIAECPFCNKAVELTKQENSILFNLERIEPSSEFTTNVMQRINKLDFISSQEKTKKDILIFRKPFLALLPVAAVIVLLLTSNITGINNKNILSISDKDDKIEQYESINNKNESATKIAVEDVNITDKKISLIDNEPSIKQSATEDNALNNESETNSRINKLDLSNENNPNRDRDTEIRISSDFITENDISFKNKTLEQKFYLLNIPEEFKLIEVKKDKPKIVTYYYTNNSNETILNISITKITDNEKTKPNEKSENDISIMNINTLVGSDENNMESDLNSLNWQTTINNESYLVSLESNLPKEELIRIFSVIKITN